jgi:hypothetical protein
MSLKEPYSNTVLEAARKTLQDAQEKISPRALRKKVTGEGSTQSVYKYFVETETKNAFKDLESKQAEGGDSAGALTIPPDMGAAFNQMAWQAVMRTELKNRILQESLEDALFNIEQLEANNDELNNQKIDLETEKGKLQADKDSVESAKKELESLKNQLENDKKELQVKLDEATKNKKPEA